MRISRTIATLGLLAATLGAPPAGAQTFSRGSTGADGAFNPPAGVTTLALPPSGVFNFTTVNVPAGATVRFTRNATNTPVTILASGDVAVLLEELQRGQQRTLSGYRVGIQSQC